MSKHQNKPPMNAELELEELTSETSARVSKSATDEELKGLVAEALLIEAIKRRRAKALAAKDDPPKK